MLQFINNQFAVKRFKKFMKQVSLFGELSDEYLVSAIKVQTQEDTNMKQIRYTGRKLSIFHIFCTNADMLINIQTQKRMIVCSFAKIIYSKQYIGRNQKISSFVLFYKCFYKNSKKVSLRAIQRLANFSRRFGSVQLVTQFQISLCHFRLN